MEVLGEDICELGRCGDADEQHLTILNSLVGEVPLDVDVLGSLPSANEVVTPLNARRVVFVDRRGRRLGETPYARGACGGTEPRFLPLTPNSTPPLP